MRVLVIRHHDVDTAGFIADAFEARGAEITMHLFPDDGPLPAYDGFDHIVVMGSISSVNDPDPWIAAEPGQRPVVREQVDVQRGPARLEGVGDEAGRVHVVVPDDEHSHRGQPPCAVAELFVWCQTI